MDKVTGKWKADVKFGHHRLDIVTPAPMLVSIDGAPVRALAAGKHKFTNRFAGTIEIDPVEPKQAYGVTLTSKRTWKTEQVDNEPPPPPPPADNYLMMLRNKVRQQMGINRENFAEQRSIYETDVQMFEEDEQAQLKRTRSESDGKTKRQAEDPGESSDQESETGSDPASISSDQDD